MTYVVVESCIKCKYMDCVEVCPVDCFYEGENMLVIHPDECIDCGVCEPECPVDAIKPDTEPGLEKWLELNAEYSKTWANITVKKEPLPMPRIGRAFRTSSKSSSLRTREPATETPARYPARDFGVVGRPGPSKSVNQFAKIAGLCPRNGGFAPHKALILPKNVLYI